MSRNKNYVNLINTATWRRLRAQVLHATPLCRDCAKEGRRTLATEVHHIIPVESMSDPERQRELCYSPGNLTALCHRCHTERHRALRKNSREENLRRQTEQTRQTIMKMWGEIPPEADS